MLAYTILMCITVTIVIVSALHRITAVESETGNGCSKDSPFKVHGQLPVFCKQITKIVTETMTWALYSIVYTVAQVGTLVLKSCWVPL